jgi:hypothetical protein
LDWINEEAGAHDEIFKLAGFHSVGDVTASRLQIEDF